LDLHPCPHYEYCTDLNTRLKHLPDPLAWPTTANVENETPVAYQSPGESTNLNCGGNNPQKLGVEATNLQCTPGDLPRLLGNHLNVDTQGQASVQGVHYVQWSHKLQDANNTTSTPQKGDSTSLAGYNLLTINNDRREPITKHIHEATIPIHIPTPRPEEVLKGYNYPYSKLWEHPESLELES
jgi:hypothetical protein